MNPALSLMSATSELLACMEKEAALIRAYNPAGLEEMQQQKEVFAMSYKAWVDNLKNKTDHAIDPKLERELMEATAKCGAAVENNMRALKAMRNINERVLQSLICAIEENRTNISAYRQNGTTKRTRNPAQVTGI